jgi:glycerol kinase
LAFSIVSRAGIITGITHQTGLAHLARALVESIGYNVNDIMKAAAKDSHSLPDSVCESE